MNAPLTHNEPHSSTRLEQVFNQCFEAQYATVLVGGATEPLYEPAANGLEFAHLHYRHDYFASALHEVAHWCLAGEQRRQLEDYGYWYNADGRDARQQQAFEDVEYRPQALEWIFSKACGWRFKISCDNLHGLDGQVPDTQQFARRILEQVKQWQRRGLPERGAVFFVALAETFANDAAAQGKPFALLDFSLSELR